MIFTTVATAKRVAIKVHISLPFEKLQKICLFKKKQDSLHKSASYNEIAVKQFNLI